MDALTRAAEGYARRRKGCERQDCQRCRCELLCLRHLGHLPSLEPLRIRLRASGGALTANYRGANERLMSCVHGVNARDAARSFHQGAPCTAIGAALIFRSGYAPAAVLTGVARDHEPGQGGDAAYERDAVHAPPFGSLTRCANTEHNGQARTGR